ncbi:unnamed protein product [Didymodactylos carnosus]|uniref:Uncharacterized protein n=1 Tax=Didymodactylos carnosus TaxID=1234261 RepID=A0A815NFE2_9BILA|nr:unnamed protein product [Didymodactylos carnosus]CAF4309882.1 unnamed protein product [Didymodactylos carnosus]
MFVRSTFHHGSPPFRGLTTTSGVIKDHQQIADILADFHEKHFEAPVHDPNVLAHAEAIDAYKNVSYIPNCPLEKITMEEVEFTWKRTRKKRSTDGEGTSAFLLKQLPDEYLNIVTYGFNKIAQLGSVLKLSKHAIVISGALESRFSTNILELGRQAELAMCILAKYTDDKLLPVNVEKTKALLVHNVVAPHFPVVKYKNKIVNLVKLFKYLGVEITTKLGWGQYISHRLKIVRKIYNALHHEYQLHFPLRKGFRH